MTLNFLFLVENIFMYEIKIPFQYKNTKEKNVFLTCKGFKNPRV